MEGTLHRIPHHQNPQENLLLQNQNERQSKASPSLVGWLVGQWVNKETKGKGNAGAVLSIAE